MSGLLHLVIQFPWQINKLFPGQEFQEKKNICPKATVALMPRLHCPSWFCSFLLCLFPVNTALNTGIFYGKEMCLFYDILATSNETMCTSPVVGSIRAWHEPLGRLKRQFDSNLSLANQETSSNAPRRPCGRDVGSEEEKVAGSELRQ